MTTIATRRLALQPSDWVGRSAEACLNFEASFNRILDEFDWVRLINAGIAVNFGWIDRHHVILKRSREQLITHAKESAFELCRSAFLLATDDKDAVEMRCGGFLARATPLGDLCLDFTIVWLGWRSQRENEDGIVDTPAVASSYWRAYVPPEPAAQTTRRKLIKLSEKLKQ